MQFSVLGSGSGGNSAVAANAHGALLIDAGLSTKQIVARLARIDVPLSAIKGILLTHEHGDHTRGLDVLLRGPLAGVPVFANAHTAEMVRRSLRAPVAWRLVETGSRFEWAGWQVETFSVPHDAVDPMGFVLERLQPGGGPRLGVVSDIGHATTSVIARLRELDALFVEANYCPQLLAADTKRPWATKQRISSRHGHLSNDQAAQLVADILTPRLRRLWLGHLSSDCNRPDVAAAVLRRALTGLAAACPEILCATQHEPTPLCPISQAAAHAKPPVFSLAAE